MMEAVSSNLITGRCEKLLRILHHCIFDKDVIPEKSIEFVILEFENEH